MKGKFPAAVVIPYKKKIFYEICKKTTRFVGSISERDLCKLYEIEKVLENAQKSACFDAYQVRGYLSNLREK